VNGGPWQSLFLVWIFVWISENSTTGAKIRVEILDEIIGEKWNNGNGGKNWSLLEVVRPWDCWGRRLMIFPETDTPSQEQRRRKTGSDSKKPQQQTKQQKNPSKNPFQTINPLLRIWISSPGERGFKVSSGLFISTAARRWNEKTRRI